MVEERQRVCERLLIIMTIIMVVVRVIESDRERGGGKGLTCGRSCAVPW